MNEHEHDRPLWPPGATAQPSEDAALLQVHRYLADAMSAEEREHFEYALAADAKLEELFLGAQALGGALATLSGDEVDPALTERILGAIAVAPAEATPERSAGTAALAIETHRQTRSAAREATGSSGLGVMWSRLWQPRLSLPTWGFAASLVAVALGVWLAAGLRQGTHQQRQPSAGGGAGLALSAAPAAPGDAAAVPQATPAGRERLGPQGAPTLPVAAAATVPMRFVLFAPGAQSVFVVGDFNAWRPDATPLQRASRRDVWVVTVPLAPGRYQYRFLVDGKWSLDPAALTRIADGFGGANSLLQL